jgi:hypothetical protein
MTSTHSPTAKSSGALYEDAHLSTQPDMRWFWSVTAIVPATPSVTNGHAATLDEAKARFRDNWTNANAGGDPDQGNG